ncbi:hypothetical protein [Cellulophaga lytica]|uniref:Uncharacterized protein n=1 Tax=Cellulophaga lytica (strain ATCC 23178 / DSM 7489 / JCM 8516 / NBRC 14961 / NCIMB 1423 / VKM B-1433 / Cy l20) TaxID=867900 RepID=F0RG25_CELLC|nr:hypothetical protein [Cellulophaga lytica]ADY28991.1 hypothetical protein Celly_1163 [Cellulophaga lytica DSM 7489]MDO6854961.1 hypothetical protein [Cellulophaga lytica]WQG76836.1 hypothetical protein SR888_14195 [Cellulophaga lytica]
MNTKLFYNHEEDRSIMMKKDKEELRNWISNLEFIAEELGYLIEIESRIANQKTIKQELHNLQKENAEMVVEMRRYNNTTLGNLECDTVECDAFYLENHERKRNEYLAHIRKYRKTKTKTFSLILLKTA